MKKISIEPAILDAAPNYQGIVICCSLVNTDIDETLWVEINAEMELLSQKYVIEDINKLPGILEMRQLYRKLGKDPNRYRPSAEALCRRILKEKSLYQINTLVDMINLVSIHTGFSIGGFDADKMAGDLKLGVGVANEKFEAIGRGLLNIEGLPVYRDDQGGIGTPTSDEERTKIDLKTTRLFMILNSANGSERLEEASDWSKRLLANYVQAKEIESKWF